MTTQQNISIDQIKLGRQIRSDLGDLDALASSLLQFGQLQPVIIDSEFRLIDGWRRLCAVRQTGRRHVRCLMVRTSDEAMKAILAKRTHDICRLPLTVSEAVDMGRRIESLERPQAPPIPAGETADDENSGPPQKLSERERESRKPKTVAAKAVGMSRPTYEKASAVVDAAKKYRRVKPILQEMNRSGNVSRAHREMRGVLERSEQLSSQESTAVQVARRIGSAVDQFISSRPAGETRDVVMAALSESLDRVEKEMIASHPVQPSST